MPEYRVLWEIDVDAANPREAAKRAREIQQDPNNIATFYSVRNWKPWGKLYEVELKPLEEPCESNSTKSRSRKSSVTRKAKASPTTRRSSGSRKKSQSK